MLIYAPRVYSNCTNSPELNVRFPSSPEVVTVVKASVPSDRSSAKVVPLFLYFAVTFIPVLIFSAQVSVSGTAAKSVSISYTFVLYLLVVKAFSRTVCH